MDVEICNDNALAQPCTDLPVISQTYKKSQIPIYDTFGPFPDETVLSSIDRLLFLLGAHRLQRLFNLPMPCMDVCSSDVSIQIELPCEKEHKRSVSITESSCASQRSQALSPRKCNCPKCQGSNSASSARSIQAQLAGTMGLPEPPQKPCKCAKPMKRSFSLCSLACRKLKQVCFMSSKNRAAFAGANLGGAGLGGLGGLGGAGTTPKWVWARVYSHPSGCEIYEVFKKSCTCMHPSQIKIDSSPKLIFVVLPNGTIMPFESLSSHM